jgi:hypothetical protein
LDVLVEYGFTDVARVFVSEYHDAKEDVRVLESLFVFLANGFVSEFKNFLNDREQSFDFTRSLSGYYLKVDRSAFTSSTVSAASRLSVYFRFDVGERLSITLKATGRNCTYLNSILGEFALLRLAVFERKELPRADG